MNLRPAVLGAADGLVSLSGVVAAALAQGGPHDHVARVGLAAACSGTVSMGNAQYASEGSTDWGDVRAMAVGTLAGAAIPVIPLFFLGGIYGIAAVTVCAIAVAVAVAFVRRRLNHKSLFWNLATTHVGLALGVAVGFALGA